MRRAVRSSADRHTSSHRCTCLEGPRPICLSSVSSWVDLNRFPYGCGLDEPLDDLAGSELEAEGRSSVVACQEKHWSATVSRVKPWLVVDMEPVLPGVQAPKRLGNWGEEAGRDILASNCLPSAARVPL